ncbi:MAG: GNAT family N-acetyltransferase [Nocardiopsaceae bacterium]|nr:GNAT family N-acetyltransferase [Nocardiopsaceae bacterium]
MDIEVRPVGDDEMERFLDVFDAAWGFVHDEGQRRHTRSVVAAESPLGAFADGHMAGTAMSFSMELTVPGQQRVPMAGVSYVAVHPLRRRRGVLRSLMRAQLDDLHARGVPLAGLGASEAGIYGRFGYGPATWDSSWRLPRGAARGLASGDHDCGLELIDARTARELLPAIHERVRRDQVGDVRTYSGRWHDLAGDGAPPGTRFLLCRDACGHPSGYAVYRIRREDRYSAHASVIVDHLIALTGAAYRGLWAYLADLDLTDQVIASGRPEREPLRWGLADGRQLVVTGVHDHLWVRLVDLPAALRRRRYAAEGSLILDIADPFCPWNEGRWLLEGGPDGAACRPAGQSPGPVLRLDAATLGSLYLGGASVMDLARAGRIGGDPDALRQARLMLGTGTTPWCSTEF